MPNVKLTQMEINKITPPSQGKEFYWDSELKGFGIRAQKTMLTFIVVGRVRGHGTQVQYTIGKYGVFSLTQARDIAKNILAKLARGENPNAERREEAIRSVTLAECFEDFKISRRLRPKTIKIYTNAMNKCFDDWKELPMAAISKDMVEKRHREISTKGGKRGSGEALANQAFRFLRTLFNYAMAKYEDAQGKSFIDCNPVHALTQRRIWNKNNKRTDYIPGGDLSAWYASVQKLRHSDAKDALLFCLLTGLRRNEVLTLKWDYINLRSKVVKIPKEVIKTGNDHEFPLSDYLFDLLERRGKIRRIGNPYVFLSKDKKTHLLEPKSAVSSVVKNSGVKFSMHSLRRTFQTHAESLEIPVFALKRLLNHSVSDITEQYTQITADRLKKPMQQITDHFSALFKGELTEESSELA
jgi:integrase